MWLHGIFKKKLQNLNLYTFYMLAIVVCIGRYYSFVTFYRSIKEDNNNLYTNQFNYGFYTATFSIILIAVSQINSINAATLKTIFVN